MQGRLVVKLRQENEYLQRVSVARGKFVSKFKKPIKEGVEKFYTDLNRKKFKEMITTELEHIYNNVDWKTKYSQILYSSTRVNGYCFSRSYYESLEEYGEKFYKNSKKYYWTRKKNKFIKEYEKTHNLIPFNSDDEDEEENFKVTYTLSNLFLSKEKLRPVKKTFSNDNFIAYNNPYVQHKISEKDKEIERLTNEKDEEIKRLKQELKKKEEKEESVKSRIDDMKDTYQLGDCHNGKLVYRYKKLRREAGLSSSYTGYHHSWESW